MSQGASVTAAVGRTSLGRLAAWAGVLALVLQVLLPLAPAQAASSLDRDIALSICHSAMGDGAPSTSALIHDHCQFCQIHAGGKLLVPGLSWSPAPPLAVPFVIPPPADDAPAEYSGYLPHPQRGPPSFA